MNPWSPSRTIAALVFAIVAYAAPAGVAVYMAGVLFLVLCKANPAQAGITSIFDYWKLYDQCHLPDPQGAQAEPIAKRMSDFLSREQGLPKDGQSQRTRP
ncbi:hypothetical protein [Roseateles sp. LYH14W]|uniref:Uncharacterized protein n=1 Tax=Pelomonas parva TaxID=3299032 RepID=A0ABW7F5G1_9BURK